MAEPVALTNRRGDIVGSADRRKVRAENLSHATTAVIVRDRHARIYVHRRSPTKDWAPSAHDAAAGGVLRYGEGPAASAGRELAEELGITTSKLLALGRFHYEDRTTSCVMHAFQTSWSGSIAHSDGEVVWGDWWSMSTLAAHLADPHWPFVPDTRALLTQLGECGIGDYASLTKLATPPGAG